MLDQNASVVPAFLKLDPEEAAAYKNIEAIKEFLQAQIVPVEGEDDQKVTQQLARTYII